MFYDDNGKVSIDPTATRETKSIQVDTVEYQNLLKLMGMDPNGTTVRMSSASPFAMCTTTPNVYSRCASCSASHSPGTTKPR